jgi:hypothetical protein
MDTDDANPRRPWPRALPAADSTSRIERRVSRLAKFLTDARTLAAAALAVVVGLVGFGWLAARRLDEIATKADVAAVRAETVTAIVTHTAAVHPGTVAELAAAAENLDAVERRVLVLETNQAWIVDALKSIADRVGARTPPTPNQ